MKNLPEDVRASIHSKDSGKAFSLVRPHLDKDPVRTLSALRDKGVLRFARYNFESTTLLTLVERIRTHIGNVGDEHPANYLDSVSALGALAPTVQSRLRRLLSDVTPFFFKRHLVAVEYLFRQLLQQNHDPNRHAWQEFTLEELADGFSYYFSLLQEHDSPTVRHLNHLPLPRSGLTHFLDNFAELARIIRFRDAETLAAHFPYRACTLGKTTFVAAINPDLEKSIRWGYIRLGAQRSADREESHEAEFPSLKDLAATFVSRLGDRAC